MKPFKQANIISLLIYILLLLKNNLEKKKLYFSIQREKYQVNFKRYERRMNCIKINLHNIRVLQNLNTKEWNLICAAQTNHFGGMLDVMFNLMLRVNESWCKLSWWMTGTSPEPRVSCVVTRCPALPLLPTCRQPSPLDHCAITILIFISCFLLFRHCYCKTHLAAYYYLQVGITRIANHHCNAM